MPLTRPVPFEAQPIIAAIRKAVPRPKTRPEFDAADVGNKPFLDSVLCWRKKDGDMVCPMGLHPSALKAMPEHEWDFPDLDLDFDEAEKCVVAFREWWDEQRDPYAAVRAVWGEA